MPRDISNWKARRSGAAITITGVELNDQGVHSPVTIAGITSIELGELGPVATTACGDVIRLAAFVPIEHAVAALQ